MANPTAYAENYLYHVLSTDEMQDESLRTKIEEAFVAGYRQGVDCAITAVEGYC